MALRFGTDGVRGPADELTDAFASALGQAAGTALGPAVAVSGSRFLVGRDTRWSGPRIEAALAAGLAAVGVEPVRAGVVPTPALAWMSAAEGIPAAMVTASHNPHADNGIKLFAAGGRKLADRVERAIEEELDRILGGAAPDGGDAFLAPGEAGPRPPSPAAAALLDGYRSALAAAIGGRSLAGLRVVVDGANGAAAALAPSVLADLGASVEAVHVDPDGRNINDGCGSTHPGDLQRQVVARGADVGLAFDGDADRVLAVAGDGSLVDGDHLIALLAVDLRDRGGLADDTVVVTVMSNLGLRLALAERGIEVVETQVGDRHVLDALESGGWSLGGEQSGHLVFRQLATTGDGLLTGIQLLDLVARAGRPLADLAAEAMTSLPQVLRNVQVPRGSGLAPAQVAADVAPDASDVQNLLGRRGRVLVRASGTEPLVRVMVEAEDAEDAEDAADRLVAAVERSFGGGT